MSKIIKRYTCEYCSKSLPSHFAKAGHISTCHRQEKRKADIHVHNVNDVDKMSKEALQLILHKLDLIAALLREEATHPSEAKTALDRSEPSQLPVSGGASDLPSFVLSSPWVTVIGERSAQLKHGNSSSLDKEKDEATGL